VHNLDLSTLIDRAKRTMPASLLENRTDRFPRPPARPARMRWRSSQGPMGVPRQRIDTTGIGSSVWEIKRNVASATIMAAGRFTVVAFSLRGVSRLGFLSFVQSPSQRAPSLLRRLRCFEALQFGWSKTQRYALLYSRSPTLSRTCVKTGA
jgi:hypothetical protein